MGRNYDICYIDYMLPSYHHPFCLICNVPTMICKRQFITRAFFSRSRLFLKMFFYDLSSFTTHYFFVFLWLLSTSFLGTLRIIAFCSRLLSCCICLLILSFSLFVTLFFPSSWSHCCPVSSPFSFWKRFRQLHSFVKIVLILFVFYIRRSNGSYFLALTVCWTNAERWALRPDICY